MKGKKETELTNSERDELEALIDKEFESTFLLPREKALTEFFIKVQTYQHEFRPTIDTKSIKVLDVFYYANCPLGFFAIEPSYDYYDSEKTVNRAELDLGYYTYSHVDDLVIKVLDENRIDYTELTDDREFDTVIFWENKGDLEIQFIIECWSKAREITNSEIIAFLHASDGSGGTYDLRNGFDLWDEKVSVCEYLERQGEKIEKETKDHQEGKKSGFWRRLFG